MAVGQNFIADKSSPHVMFMPGLFNETLQLLHDSYEYFSMFGDDDRSRIETNLKTLYSCEMSRITLRLSAIMAWLMAQRAVFAGQIEASEAARRHGLDFHDICLVDNRVLHGVLPSYVCFLLDRSLELYERVYRLDNQFRNVH